MSFSHGTTQRAALSVVQGPMIVGGRVKMMNYSNSSESITWLETL